MSRTFHVYGHRGWPRRYPDNTLAGLLAAAAVCDGVEVDVRRSGDGKLVLSHDALIGGFDVAGSPWSTLAEVDLGGGAKPCLLDEVVSALPHRGVLMEIKNQPWEPGFEPDHRLALEAASRARDLDVVMSFNWSTADAVRATFPEVETALVAGVLGDVSDAISHALDKGHRHLALDVDLLTLADVAVPSDLAIVVWSGRGDEPWGGMLDELASRGVSGIISDDPAVVAQLVGSSDVDQG